MSVCTSARLRLIVQSLMEHGMHRQEHVLVSIGGIICFFFCLRRRISFVHHHSFAHLARFLLYIPTTLCQIIDFTVAKERNIISVVQPCSQFPMESLTNEYAEDSL